MTEPNVTRVYGSHGGTVWRDLESFPRPWGARRACGDRAWFATRRAALAWVLGLPYHMQAPVHGEARE